MVHFAVTCLVGLLALLQPATAAPQRQIGASDSTTCIADGKMYRSGNSYRMNSINYVVRCAKDSSGPSFRTHKVPFGGFSMCFEVCERTSGCAGFSFVGSKEGGNCYLKASVGGYVTASDETVTCEKDPGGSGGEPEPMPSSHSSYHWPVSSSTTVVSSSTSGHSSSSVSASVSSHSGHHHHHASGHPHSSASSTHAPAPTKSTGDQCKKTIAQGYSVVVEGGDSYELSCGSDHYGGDFSRADSKSFIGCVRLCDVQPECLGYSYESGVCFLKNSLSGLRSAPGIDFALNLNRTGPSYTASSQYSTSSISASVHHSKPASSTPSEVVLVTVTSYTSSATPSSVSSEYSSEEHHYHHHHHHTKSHGHHTESMAQEWSPHHQTESSESKHHSHHHTKSHHPKPHHTKSHHYTTGSTVTAYVSETYTHTNWITSVSPTTSAEIHHSHTHSHTHTDTHTFHHHNKPIETYTPHPEQETNVADENHCLSLRQEHVQLKKLRVEVITGSKEYEGMYVKDPSRGHSGIAHLCSSKEEAASITINPNTTAVLSWHNEEGCSFRGLNMRSYEIHHKIGGIRDHFNLERYGDAVFSPDTASGGMRIVSDYLLWSGQLWTYWLACEADGGEPELKYWGVGFMPMAGWVQGKTCATVRLRVVV